MVEIPMGTPRCPTLVANPGPPESGVPTYYLAKICRKLHENEGNWTEPGDERPKFDYVDPPLSPFPFWEFVHYTSDIAGNKQHSVRSTWWLISGEERKRRLQAGVAHTIMFRDPIPPLLRELGDSMMTTDI